MNSRLFFAACFLLALSFVYALGFYAGSSRVDIKMSGLISSRQNIIAQELPNFLRNAEIRPEQVGAMTIEQLRFRSETAGLRQEFRQEQKALIRYMFSPDSNRETTLEQEERLMQIIDTFSTKRISSYLTMTESLTDGQREALHEYLEKLSSTLDKL